MSKKLLLIALLVTLPVAFANGRMTLTKVVTHTVTTNPEILASAYNRNASNQQVKQARGGYFPQVDATLGYGYERSRNNSTRNAAGKIRGEDLTRKEARIELKQMVFDGFATYNEVLRTRAKTNADSYKVFGTSENVGLAAIEAYLYVRMHQNLVGIAQENLATHQRTYKMVKRRSESGLGRMADISQVTGRLALAKANLLSAQSSLNDARTIFIKVTGLQAKSLAPAPTPKPADLPHSLKKAIDIALKNHPILRSAKADVAEAQAQRRVAIASNFPRVDLVLAAGKNRGMDGIPGPNDEALAMVRMQYNLLRGGSDLARQRETGYLTYQAKSIADNTRRQVIENVRLAWNAMLIARDRLPKLRIHQNAAAETVVAYRKQFSIGKRTLLDLLDSENELFRSRQAYTEGLYTYVLAKYRVLSATGQLLSYLKVRLPMQANLLYREL